MAVKAVALGLDPARSSAGVPAVFAPDYAPEEISEIAEKLREHRVAEGADRPCHRSPEGDQTFNKESDVALEGRRALEVELA